MHLDLDESGLLLHEMTFFMIKSTSNFLQCNNFVFAAQIAIYACSAILNMGHSMSNQHKKILTPTDLNENWFLHSVS